MKSHIQFKASETKHFRQHGVNGETICSNLGTGCVKLNKLEFDNMAIIINDAEVDQIDGYVGLGFLRMFNILITTDGVFFIRNEKNARQYSEYETIARNGKCGNK